MRSHARFVVTTLALLLVGCGPRPGSSAAPADPSGGGEEGAPSSEDEAGTEPSGGEPAAAGEPCKPDGTEVSHYSACCSNEAYVEQIEDNGAWHTGRRLCGREP